MGWGRMLLLRNIGQQMDIDEAKEQLQEGLARSHDDRAALQRDLRALQNELDRVKLLNMALIRLLVAQRIVDDDALGRMVDELDRQDGVQDGKLAPQTPQDPEQRAVRFDAQAGRWRLAGG